MRAAPLLRGYAADLASEAKLDLLARGVRRPRDQEIAATVRRLAEREKKSRQREAQRAAESKTPDAPRRKVPPLFPRLAKLAPFAPDVGRFQRVLGAAMHTVATNPGVLKDQQLRLFDLTYVEGRSLAELTGMLRASSERTTQRRLRLVSKRIEAELLDRVHPVLSQPSWAIVYRLTSQKCGRPGPPERKISNDTSEAMKRACAEFLSAVEAVIHRGPGHPLSHG